ELAQTNPIANFEDSADRRSPHGLFTRRTMRQPNHKQVGPQCRGDCGVAGRHMTVRWNNNDPSGPIVAATTPSILRERDCRLIGCRKSATQAGIRNFFSFCWPKSSTKALRSFCASVDCYRSASLLDQPD